MTNTYCVYCDTTIQQPATTCAPCARVEFGETCGFCDTPDCTIDHYAEMDAELEALQARSCPVCEDVDGNHADDCMMADMTPLEPCAICTRPSEDIVEFDGMCERCYETALEDAIEATIINQLDLAALKAERAQRIVDAEKTRLFMEEMNAKGISDDDLPF